MWHPTKKLGAQLGCSPTPSLPLKNSHNPHSFPRIFFLSLFAPPSSFQKMQPLWKLINLVVISPLRPFCDLRAGFSLPTVRRIHFVALSGLFYHHCGGFLVGARLFFSLCRVNNTWCAALVKDRLCFSPKRYFVRFELNIFLTRRESENL